MSVMTNTAGGRRERARLSLASSVAHYSPTISFVEALDALASQLLALGWIVRMPRTAWDSQVGVIAVGVRAFSTTALVQLDANRRLSLMLPSGEQQPVSDVAELVGKLRERQHMQAAADCEAVPA